MESLNRSASSVCSIRRVFSQSTRLDVPAGIAWAPALASMSYLAESIQPGPPCRRLGEAEMPYAFRISARTELFVAVNLPPGKIMEGEHTSELQSRLHLVCRLLHANK